MINSLQSTHLKDVAPFSSFRPIVVFYTCSYVSYKIIRAIIDYLYKSTSEKNENEKKQNMKQLIRIFALVITLNFVSAIFPGKISAQQNNVYFQEFYDQLSPYGQWIDDSEYGYIWIPTAGPDFIPYLSNGYWVFTDYGWTWVSDYEWGWAVFLL